jgi:hypothetical protein
MLGSSWGAAQLAVPQEGLRSALCGAETWTLRKLDQKYLESFKMCVMEKISWTNRASNETVLHRVKEERNILHTIRWRKANWTGNILPSKTHYWRKDYREQKARKETLVAFGWREGSWRRKLRIALFGELSLEEAMDLSQDRLLLELEYFHPNVKSNFHPNSVPPTVLSKLIPTISTTTPNSTPTPCS